MTNRTDVDETNSEELAKATIICRRQMMDIVAFLRKFMPGYEKCFIISSASMIGVRETRHFKGKYTLTKQDILKARQFGHRITRDEHFNYADIAAVQALLG